MSASTELRGRGNVTAPWPAAPAISEQRALLRMLGNLTAESNGRGYRPSVTAESENVCGLLDGMMASIESLSRRHREPKNQVASRKTSRGTAMGTASDWMCMSRFYWPKVAKKF